MQSGGEDWAGRLAALRAEIAAQGLDGFVVPMADQYQNEYVPPQAQRITWLTGFTGSAGMVVVLAETAAAFTDGRYTLQIAGQVDSDLYDCLNISETPPPDWIAQNLKRGAKLGFDSWLFTQDGVGRFRKGAEAAGGALVPVRENPLDKVWLDQPDAPMALVVPHDISFSGVDSADKRAQLAKDLTDAGRDAVVLTATDSIAWLLNIRGGDVSHSPLPLSLAILHSDGKGDGRVDLFLDDAKRGRGLGDHLGNDVSIQPPDSFATALDALSDKVVQVDPGSTAAWVFERLGAAGAKIARGVDPCQLPKAIKNDVELAGARTSHARDGVALARFLHWLDVFAPQGELDELGAEAQLEEYRRDGDHFKDLSFPTITGSGPNGAIVHYRVTPDSNRILGTGEFSTVPLTSPAPSPSAPPAMRCGTALPASSRATSPSQPRAFPLAPPAHSWMCWPATPCGRRGWISTTERATVWAATSTFTRGRTPSQNGSKPRTCAPAWWSRTSRDTTKPEPTASASKIFWQCVR
jgi:Xaa-Pro aminopeptidase